MTAEIIVLSGATLNATTIALFEERYQELVDEINRVTDLGLTEAEEHDIERWATILHSMAAPLRHDFNQLARFPESYHAFTKTDLGRRAQLLLYLLETRETDQ